MAEFGVLNWIIVAIYLTCNLALGYAMSLRVKTAEDYALGARTTPWWAIGISVVATYVSALSFLGGPAWAYGDGMKALAIHINYPLVIFIVVAVFIPFFYNSGVASIYEYLERRFGPTSRSVMSALFLITQTITAGSILTATAIVVSFATGLDVRLSIVLMTAVVLVYTMMGGITAVIWTDVLQGFVLLAGAGIVLFGLFAEVSPLSEAFTHLKEDGKLNAIDTSLDFSVAPTIWSGVFAITLFHITVYGANQMMVQRALAAKNIGDAKKSYLMMGYAAFFLYFTFFFVGALLYEYFDGREFDQPNEIILVFAQGLAIPGLMGILAAAVLSASMSSLSSAFNSLATVSVVDFYEKFAAPGRSAEHYLLMSRIFTVLWGVAAIPIAFMFVESGGSILEELSRVASYFVGAKLAMFGLGFFSKHTTERGLLVGVAAGFVGLYLLVNGAPFLAWTPPDIAWPWFVVIGGGINIVVSWTASVILDGFQPEWHAKTVPGQFKAMSGPDGPPMDNGWHLTPGRIDRSTYGLLIFFVATLIFLNTFQNLG